MPLIFHDSFTAVSSGCDLVEHKAGDPSWVTDAPPSPEPWPRVFEIRGNMGVHLMDEGRRHDLQPGRWLLHEDGTVTPAPTGT